MRKYIIGTLVGFCLSLGVGVHAEVKNLIDKVVEGSFPVTIDGKKLESDAVVIEGSTYLPVRAFGEAIGYKVGFDADLGVNLSKSVTESTYSQTDEPAVENPKYQKMRDLYSQKEALQKQIVDLAPIIAPYEKVIAMPGQPLKPKEKDDLYYETKKIRDEAIAKRDEIDQQIKELANK